MVDISATCKKQLIINYNFFDRAHCRTDRTIAILCVSWSDKMQFYIGDNLLALHNYPRQLRSHHSSSEPFTSVQRYRYIALYTTQLQYDLVWPMSYLRKMSHPCLQVVSSSPVTVLTMSLDVLLARLHLLKVMVHNTFESMLCTYILTRHRNIISRDILLDVCTKLLQSALSSTKFTSLHLRDIQSAQVSLLDGTSSLFFLHQHSKTKPLSCARTRIQEKFLHLWRLL